MCQLFFLQKNRGWSAMSPCTPPHCQCSNKQLGTLWERLKQLMKPPAHGTNLDLLSPFSTPPAWTHSGSLLLLSRSWVWGPGLAGTLTWWGNWAALSGCSLELPRNLYNYRGWPATRHMKAQVLGPSLYSNMFSKLKSAWVHHCHLCNKECHLVSLLLSPPIKWM